MSVRDRERPPSASGARRAANTGPHPVSDRRPERLRQQDYQGESSFVIWCTTKGRNLENIENENVRGNSMEHEKLSKCHGIL